MDRGRDYKRGITSQIIEAQAQALLFWTMTLPSLWECSLLGTLLWCFPAGLWCLCVHALVILHVCGLCTFLGFFISPSWKSSMWNMLMDYNLVCNFHCNYHKWSHRFRRIYWSCFWTLLPLGGLFMMVVFMNVYLIKFVYYFKIVNYLWCDTPLIVLASMSILQPNQGMAQFGLKVHVISWFYFFLFLPRCCRFINMVGVNVLLNDPISSKLSCQTDGL